MPSVPRLLKRPGVLLSKFSPNSQHRASSRLLRASHKPWASSLLQRLPIISHLSLILLVVFGPTHAPYLLATVFLLTHVIFAATQVRLGFGMLCCFLYTRAHSKTNWWSFFLRASRQTLDDSSDANSDMSMTHEHLNFVNLPHIIILPSYKESETTLIQTLSVLASHPLAKHAYKVCLAMEEREVGSLAKGETLKARFQAKFRSLTVTIHPADIEGELSGKGSNVRWAARYMAELECLKSDPNPRLPLASRVLPERIPNAVITVMDADTAFAGDYFLAVSAKYLLANPEKQRQMMFIPPLIFDRNQSDVPTVTRVTDIFWAAAGIGGIYPSSGAKLPTSAYSVSLALAVQIGFWDAGPQAIGEDMHMFCKSMLDTRGNVHAETIYSPASQCNVVGNHGSGSGPVARFLSDCSARWTQAVRHMWGSLDTGYVATRLVLGDIGISPERAFKEKLLRQEMRTIIQGELAAQSTASSRCHSVVGDAPAAFQGSGRKSSDKHFASTHPLRQHPGFAAIDFEEEGEGAIHRGPRPSIVSSSESSTFTMSSGSTGPPSPTDSDSDSLASFNPAEARVSPAVPLVLPNQQPQTIVTPSHQASSNARNNNNLQVLSITLMLLRLYEAHLMICHLVILVVPFIIWPAVQSRLQLLMASQPSVWGYHISAPATPHFDHIEPWSLARDQVLSSSIRLSQYLSLIGSIGSVVMCICYDLYHREACLRWDESVTERRDNSRTSKFATILYYLPSTLSRAFSLTQEESTRLLSKDERALMKQENDDDIEASAADSKPPFNPMDLGIRPSPFSRRNLPWCLVDYVAIPAALFFGVAPLIYAQVCQIWTDRLVYRVSGKPQVSNGATSKEGETA